MCARRLRLTGSKQLADTCSIADIKFERLLSAPFAVP
jgi:hypothetical protein